MINHPECILKWEFVQLFFCLLPSIFNFFMLIIPCFGCSGYIFLRLPFPGSFRPGWCVCVCVHALDPVTRPVWWSQPVLVTHVEVDVGCRCRCRCQTRSLSPRRGQYAAWESVSQWHDTRSLMRNFF